MSLRCVHCVCIRAQAHTVLLLHMYLISMVIREAQRRHVLLVIRAYLPLVCRSYKETCSSDLAAQNHVEHSSGSSAFIEEPGQQQTSSASSLFHLEKAHPRQSPSSTL